VAKPININKIPAHVRAPGGPVRSWLKYLDKIADRGKPDGKFTEKNFKYFQRLGFYWLKTKYPKALDIRRFRKFSQFKKFIDGYVWSQRCKDPKIIKKTKVIDGPRFYCVPPPQPKLPRLIIPRIKKRKPKRIVKQKPKAPPKSPKKVAIKKPDIKKYLPKKSIKDMVPINPLSMRGLKSKKPISNKWKKRVYKTMGWEAKVRDDGSITFKDKYISYLGIRNFAVTFAFDITDIVMRAMGQDPYVAAKLEYMRKTRPWRMQLRKRWKAKIERQHLTKLGRRLLKMWKRKNLTYAKKRAILFKLWNEYLEPDGSESSTKAQIGRKIIIKFIRKYLPKGSANAYTEKELDDIADERAGLNPFVPYIARKKTASTK
jgi:hypothetical protein